MRANIEIREANQADAVVIGEIHLTARREAMPYLPRPHTDEEMREHYARVVGDRLGSWWVACCAGEIVGYMLIDHEDLDELYVRPGWQRQGVGMALLGKAKALSPERIELRTFQRNANARAFYEAQGFRVIGCTDGDNEENEPDVKFEWRPAR